VDSKLCRVDPGMESQQGSFWRDPIRGILSIAAWSLASMSAHCVGGADSYDDRLRGCNWESAHKDDECYGNRYWL